MPANHLFSSKVIHKIWHSISIICVHYEMLHEGDIFVLYMQYTQCNHSWLISSKCMAFLSYPPATTLDFPKLTLPWSATPQAEHHATSCMYDLVYLLTSFLQMKDIYKVRYKTCTLDSGLDDGLDYRLNFGLGWTVISSELAVYRRVAMLMFWPVRRLA